MNAFHNNYFKYTPCIHDGNWCPDCDKKFKYINRDGTVNTEQYNEGLLKSIQQFQRPRTEYYRKDKGVKK